MKGDSTAVITPFPTKIAEPFATEVLQGVFSSEADRDAFLQAVTMHGVTFLRCADAPMQRPTSDQLSTLEKLARSVSRLWPRASSSPMGQP